MRSATVGRAAARFSDAAVVPKPQPQWERPPEKPPVAAEVPPPEAIKVERQQLTITADPVAPLPGPGVDWEVRELNPEEYQLLMETPFFKEFGWAPDPVKSRVFALIDPMGRVKGFWFAYAALHLEPLWIDEQYRGNPAILRSFWKQMRTCLQQTGEQAAFCMIAEQDEPRMLPQALGLGFVPQPGKLYACSIEKMFDRSKLRKRDGEG